MKEILPAKTVWMTLLLSITLVSTAGFAILGYFQYVHTKQLKDPKFKIVALAQTTRDGELLKTGYLAELLDLSVDRPSSLFSFNVKAAEQQLKENPLIKEIILSKVKPGTLMLEYELRRPLAFLGDYANTALDNEGALFPFHPFYTPKKLPEIWLGTDHQGSKNLWGTRLSGSKIELALSILEHLKTQFADQAFFVSKIDVSNAFSLSYAQRQIVLLLEERTLLNTQQRILRLDSAQWRDGLLRYAQLRRHLSKNQKTAKTGEASPEKSSLIVDLRPPHQALYYAP